MCQHQAYHGHSAKIPASCEVIVRLQTCFCHNWWHCSVAASRSSVAAVCVRTFYRGFVVTGSSHVPWKLQMNSTALSPTVRCSSFLLSFVCLFSVMHCLVVTRGTSTPNCLATIFFSSYKHCVKDNSQYLQLRFKTCQYCSLYHSHCNYF